MKKFFTNRLLHTALLLILLGAALMVRTYDYDWIRSLRFLAFDSYNRLYPRPPTDRVVIVDINEASLREDRLGQWPWPRTTVAALVDQLSAMGAKAIVFDTVFAEKDRTSPSVFLKKLPEDSLSPDVRAELSRIRDHDAILAEAFARAGNVVTGFVWSWSSGAEARKPRQPRSIILTKNTESLQKRSEHIYHVVSTLSELEQAAAGNGHFGIKPEIDGIIRSVPLVLGFKGVDAAPGDMYPLLALEALRVAETNNESLVIRPIRGMKKTNFSPDYEIGVGRKYRIPIDDNGKFLVYFSKARLDQYIPAWKVVNGSLDPNMISGKIVLVGSSAEGLKDLRSTPLDLFIPGVEVHLNIIEQILQGKYLYRPPIVEWQELLFTLGIGLLTIALASFLNAVLLAGITITMISGITLASVWIYKTQGLLIDPVYPSLTIFGISIVAALLAYIRTEMERRAVRQAFGFYISPDYMKELTRNPDQLRLGGEMRDISVMFTDIRGFTSISERLKPDTLIQLINDFLTPMSDLVMSNRGTIDKYMGDALMAFWNAPLDDPDHARNACLAALSMNNALNPVNERLAAVAREKGGEPIVLKAGIGINSGPGAVGNMGSRQRFAYSVMGDTVNLASRLEGQTKHYGVDILVGENTYNAVKDFAALELDLIRVKGKLRPVRIYTLLGDSETAIQPSFRALKDSHKAMLSLYRSLEFKSALERLDECLLHAPESIHGYYAIMHERIKSMQKAPPDASWDGVFVATSK
jgi:adenylate cyclase